MEKGLVHGKQNYTSYAAQNFDRKLKKIMVRGHIYTIQRAHIAQKTWRQTKRKPTHLICMYAMADLHYHLDILLTDI
jgi:hypothetical protein